MISTFLWLPDPNEDQFEKHSKERAEKIAKNEYQRLSNISKAQKGKRLKGSIFVHASSGVQKSFSNKLYLS